MPDKLPLHALPEHNLFGLEDQSYDNARVVVLPVPYDSTVTYKAGTREGPDAIISASRNIELYSYEIGGDPSKLGIYTLPSMAPDLSSPEKMVANIKREVGILLDDGKLPLMLGGEHTITLGALQALKEKKQDVSIIHFDAHSDTRDELFGARYMHATVMSRARELFPEVFQVGLRSIDADYAKKMDRKKTLLMDDVQEMGTDEVIRKINSSTGESVYLTFDFDVLDPSEMPSVGTPEPNGMRFAEVVKLMKGIGKEKILVGADFVELCPIPYMHAPDFLAAKLIYLTLGSFLLKGGANE
ncbi:MAG: agmatinase [Candidatus Marsarchaeota archaeon]|nr:agmatinase [Candidatus Marsarchaeota archaeon]